MYNECYPVGWLGNYGDYAYALEGPYVSRNDIRFNVRNHIPGAMMDVYVDAKERGRNEERVLVVVERNNVSETIPGDNLEYAIVRVYINNRPICSYRMLPGTSRIIDVTGTASNPRCS